MSYLGYHAQILADSVSPDGVRLTTLEVTFPRFILAEVNTHRMLSRNSASSRAIPPEAHISRVIENPFIPLTFNKRVKGMGVGEELDSTFQGISQEAWLASRDAAVRAAQVLIKCDVDKSRVNRLLEPFMWHTAIISATEWSNFFALRDHPDAQPEFQLVARRMKQVMEESTPKKLDYGQWHLPLITDSELRHLCNLRLDVDVPQKIVDSAVDDYKLVSVRRCARVSFDKHTDSEPWEVSIEKAQALLGSGHLSPCEHVARPAEPYSSRQEEETFYGNFRGWVQFRKQIPNEDDFAKQIAEEMSV